MNRRALAAAFAFAAFLGSASARADLPVACGELGLALTEHSCFHATYGPYQTVTASAGLVDAVAAPNVDAVHTYYDVVLPTPSGENTVSYKVASAGRRGTWAVFHDARVPIRVLSESGQVLPTLLSHDVASCPFLPRVDVFELEDARYRVVLGPSSVTRSVLVVENVSDFTQASGRDADGDGYGNRDDTILTPCTPGVGYVQNASDCNDADPAVHPAAIEMCDGVDQNCNGVADDVGLPCTAGLGQCRANGTMRCDASLASAVCSATPLGPRPESCDGVDDDCDGASDLAEGSLCTMDPEAPACVLVLGTTRCGCDADEDCGGPTSGRICDLATRRCKKGCVALPGRNGCPADLACTSSDPGNPGACAPPGSACDGGTCDGGATADADASPAGPLAGGDGCSCRTTAVPRTSSGLLLVGVLAVVVALRRRRLAMAGFMCMLTHCGGKLDAVPEGRELSPDAATFEDAADPATCVPELGGKVVVHACSHAKNGPFETVIASDDDKTTPPGVSLVHRTYDVVMPSETAPFRGVVAYTPTRDGAHVVFTDPEVDLVVRSNGAILPIEHQEAIPKMICSVLASSSVVTLEKGEAVRIELAGSSGREVKLFVEHLATFSDAAWAKECP